MALPLAGAIAAGVDSALGNTVKNSIVKAASKVAQDKSVPEVKPADAAPVAEAMIDALSKDKTFINATSSEPWWQSRVALGSIVAALGVVLPPLLALFGVDTTADKIVEFGTAVVTLGGALFALYGRLATGLKPLFSRKG